MAQIANLIGLLGVALLLLAYFFLQSGKLTSAHMAFPVLNLAGSLMILFSLFYEWNFPAVVIETVWALISIFGICRILSARKK